MKKSRILPGAIFSLLVIAAASLNAQDWVTFDGKTPTAEKLPLAGILTSPGGDGPFPAVVMLCGCGGLKKKDDAEQQASWAERLVNWGYVTLQVDSFGPRDFDNICTKPNAVNDWLRSMDAFAAKAYLSGLSFVDSDRIGVIGWSHGGWTVMKVVDAFNRDKDCKPFQAAVAVYPLCAASFKRDTPLLILIGAKDDSMPAKLCESRMDGTLNDGKYEQKLIIYPNAHHAFDFEGMKKDENSHHFEYDPETAADAIVQTRDFLAKYLKAK